MSESQSTLAVLQPIFWIIGVLFSAILVALPFVVAATNRNIRTINDKVDKFGTTTTEIYANLKNLTTLVREEVSNRREQDASRREFEHDTTTSLARLEVRVTELERNFGQRREIGSVH